MYNLSVITLIADRNAKRRKENNQNISMGLFSRKRNTKKKKAIAFVDFEHWYISLEKLHKQKPDIRAWRDELAEKYDIADIYFFADFSNPSLRSEIEKIRQVTNLIIETKNASNFYKKDFTDFIMLDNIYQAAIDRKNIDTFVIFSGDGHFSSVATYLRTRCNKEVGIYGIRDAISTQLKNVASWVNEIPAPSERLQGYYYPILQNLKNLEERSKSSYPSFKATSEYVAKYYVLDQNEVREAMQEMIKKGYLYQTEENVSGRSIRVLRANWSLAASDGIWNAEAR